MFLDYAGFKVTEKVSAWVGISVDMWVNLFYALAALTNQLHADKIIGFRADGWKSPVTLASDTYHIA